MPLVESTPGRYTASWSAVGRAFLSTSCSSTPGIFPDGTYTIRVFDSASQLVHQASTVRLTGVSQVTRTPDHFAPAAGETTTVTVTAAAGLNLEARFGNSQAAVRTIARREQARLRPTPPSGTAATPAANSRRPPRTDCRRTRGQRAPLRAVHIGAAVGRYYLRDGGSRPVHSDRQQHDNDHRRGHTWPVWVEGRLQRAAHV